MIQQTQNSTSDTQNKLSQVYSRSQFTAIVKDLLASMRLSSPTRIELIYNQLLAQHGAVTGQQIVDAVGLIREADRERQQIFREIGHYKRMIADMASKNITTVTNLEFRQVMAGSTQGQITDLLAKKIDGIGYVSLKKLARMLEKIEELQHTKNIEQQVQLESLNDSQIIFQCSVLDFSLADVLSYLQSIPLDPVVRTNLQAMLNHVQSQHAEQSTQILALQQTQDTLRAHQQSIEDELYNCNRMLDQLQDENARLRESAAGYRKELQDWRDKYRQEITVTIAGLMEENERLGGQVAGLALEKEELQAKGEWFRAEYEALAKQYGVYLKEASEEQSRRNNAKEERMFAQRTLKEQLEDSQAKLTRLRQENALLQQMINETAASYQNKISFLESRIQQLEESRNMYRISTLDQKSHLSRSALGRSTIKGDPFASQLLYDQSADGERPDAARMSRQYISNRSSIFEQILKEHVVENGFRKKHLASIIANDQISLLEVEPVDIGDAQNIFDEKPDKKTSANGVQSPDKRDKDPAQKKKTLTSLGYLITPDSHRHPTYILFSEDTIAFYDSKKRLTTTIRYQQLASIIFCHYNSHWIVLKARPNELNDKKQPLHDKVVSTVNRPDVLEFLQIKCSHSLFRAGTRLFFESQTNIMVTPNSGSQYLVSNFTQFYNLYRLSIANPLFEVSVKLDSFFGGQTSCILVVTDIGMLCFQRDGDYLLERERKLIDLIPIVEDMEIEMVGDKKITVKYPMAKKVGYKLELGGYALTCKLKKIMEGYRIEYIRRKEAEKAKYSLLTAVLDQRKATG